jgi:uncharacterized membrane protein
MNDQGKVIGALVAGAGLMYLLDPDRGVRRRALARDQVVRGAHKLSEGLDATARDVGNRARGTAAKLRSRRDGEEVDDEVLHERIRSAAGRAVSHPGAIEADVFGGRVVLHGAVLEGELETLLDAVRRVRGVTEVINELEVYPDANGAPSLQGGRRRVGRPQLAQENWAPGTRALVGALGGILAYSGVRIRGAAGPVIATVGAGLLARAGFNLSARRLTGIGAGRRAVDVQKVINVNAPVEKVWELWSNFENFPRFMAHLVEVRRTGERSSHWVARGPAGARVEWDAVTTAREPNQLVAWKSVEGSTVDSAGRVRFRQNPDGATQIDVRISYNPPGGALGHTVAALFGVDPKRAMDEDLVRLKSLLEEGRTRADQEQVSLDEVTSGAASGRTP